MLESDTSISTSRTVEPMVYNNTSFNDQTVSKDMAILKEIKTISPNIYDINTLIHNLESFNLKLKNLKYISVLFTNEFLDILKKIEYRGNIRLDLTLKSVYLTIISHDSLYNNYLLFDENDIYKTYKINFLLNLINDCIYLVETLSGFVFDEELFIFKKKTTELLKCIYFNCKSKINNEETLKKTQELLDILPQKFYSNVYIELNKNKDLYNILKTKNLDSIANFESKLLDINNYYEQYEVFKNFVEINSGDGLGYTSVGNDNNINVENNNNTSTNAVEIINFYHNYGLLLLKFCKYHYYVFLDKTESAEDKEINEEENENSRVVFLLDKYKHKKVKEKEKENEKEEGKPENNKDKEKTNSSKVDLLIDKQFQSILDTKEYKILIKKEIMNYLNITKNFQSNPNIKSLRDQMTYFITTLEAEGFVPLYLKEFNKISISDNFTPSFSTNVPAGKENKIYLETMMNENMLLYIEFFLEDKSKDITFEVNKYDISNESFKQIFKEENVAQTFKFFVLCNGYSLYEIVFNNDYSWFNSKDINYRISLLKLLPKTFVGESFHFNLNGKDTSFNSQKIFQKMLNKEDEKEINIPVILYLNNLRIATIVKKENDKEDIEFKEKEEKEEKYIPKPLFDYSIIDHLKKLKIKSDEKKKIIISIYSQNRNLKEKNPEIEEKIKNPENKNSSDFLEKIGFIPTTHIGEYKVEYKLYDLCEQNLVYYLFLLEQKKDPINKTILFLKFDKLVVNYAIYDNKNITIKLKEKTESNTSQGNIEEFIFNFIKNANKIYNGINLVMNYIDYKDEEQKKKIDNLIARIKKYATEKLEPPVPVIFYGQNAIDIQVFKYMNYFYD